MNAVEDGVTVTLYEIGQSHRRRTRSAWAAFARREAPFGTIYFILCHRNSRGLWAVRSVVPDQRGDYWAPSVDGLSSPTHIYLATNVN